VDAAAGMLNAAGTDAIKVADALSDGLGHPGRGGHGGLYPTTGEFERNPVPDLPSGRTVPRSPSSSTTSRSKSCGDATGADADAGDGQGCWNARRTARRPRWRRWIDGTVVPAPVTRTC
jgi:hypothetical protein